MQIYTAPMQKYSLPISKNTDNLQLFLINALYKNAPQNHILYCTQVKK